MPLQLFINQLKKSQQEMMIKINEKCEDFKNYEILYKTTNKIKRVLLMFLCLTVFMANAQTKLETGDRIEAEISKNEQDVYTLKVKKGAYLDMLIQQSGVDVQITLVNEKNDTLQYFDSPTGENGVEKIKYVFEQSGMFKLVIEPLSVAINGITEPKMIKEFEAQNQGKYSIERVNVLTAKEYALKLEKEEKRLQEVVNRVYEKALSLKNVEPESRSGNKSIKKEGISALIRKGKETNSEAVIVYRNNELLMEEYFGIGHKDTLIESMSCTKSIVGLAAACLLDDGLLDSLDTPVYHFYPEWNQGRKKDITVWHLLTMTSGIQNYRSTAIEIYPSPDFVKLALAAELTEAPGEAFSYNNKSLNLMAGVFKKITGKRMDKYIEERLLKPLNIETYNWVLDEAGNPHAMSGFQVKPIDFAKFGLLLLNEGMFQNKQIISKKHIAEVVKPISQNKTYGLLWWLDYDGIKFTVDDEIINELKRQNVAAEFIIKMEQLKGAYLSEAKFVAKVIEIFGENPREYIESNGLSIPQIRKREFTGDVKVYRADGYLGNYIYVLPNENMVGVRMISGKSHDSAKDNFIDFGELLQNLVE